MNVMRMCRTGTCVGALLLTACTPALNWRSVGVGDATAMLPCKPDIAQRMVHLGSQDLTLHMVGCEAGGALFAISQTRLPPGTPAAAVLADWRQSALTNLHAEEVSAMPSKAPRADVQTLLLRARGKRPNSTAVDARLLWWATDTQVLHVAVYADAISPDMTETLFSEIKIP